MSRWRAIVFDLDDTLYPERDYVLSGFKAVAAWAKTQLSISSELGFNELNTLFEEGVRGNTFDKWLEKHRLKSNWVPQMVEVYRNHEPDIKPYPEAPGLLKKLHSDFRLGLLSDGYSSVQKRKLASLRLESFFDAIVLSDEWGRNSWKPNPRPFEIVVDKLGVNVFEAIYVADNPIKDFYGARSICMHTIRIRHCDGLYSHLEPPTLEHAPDAEIKDLREMETILSDFPD